MRLVKELEKKVQKLERATNDHIRESKTEMKLMNAALTRDIGELYKKHIDRHLMQQKELDKLAEKDKAQDALMLKDNARIVKDLNAVIKREIDGQRADLEDRIRIVDSFNESIKVINKNFEKNQKNIDLIFSELKNIKSQL